jgi:hypothetical protein
MSISDEEYAQLVRERDDARELAVEAMRGMDDDQLLDMRLRLMERRAKPPVDNRQPAA